MHYIVNYWAVHYAGTVLCRGLAYDISKAVLTKFSNSRYVNEFFRYYR